MYLITKKHKGKRKKNKEYFDNTPFFTTFEEI